jgi:hypothetical protein
MARANARALLNSPAAQLEALGVNTILGEAARGTARRIGP